MRWRKIESVWAGLGKLVLLTWVLAYGRAQAQEFQTWNEVDLMATWRNAAFVVPLLARVDPQLPNPQLAAVGITADFPLPWRLTLTAGYLFADLPQRSVQVHVPLIALTTSFSEKKWTIADRNRFEKLADFPGSPVRYRNRLLGDRRIGQQERWHVFASDEAIFDISAGNWTQNRFQVGAGRRLTARLSLDVYYLLRNANAAPLTHVVGTTLKLALRP